MARRNKRRPESQFLRNLREWKARERGQNTQSSVNTISRDSGRLVSLSGGSAGGGGVVQDADTSPGTPDRLEEDRFAAAFPPGQVVHFDVDTTSVIPLRWGSFVSRPDTITATIEEN